MVAYFDNQFMAICHCSCEWLLANSSFDTCPVYSSYRKGYNGMLKSIVSQTEAQHEAAIAASSHVNLTLLKN